MRTDWLGGVENWLLETNWFRGWRSKLVEVEQIKLSYFATGVREGGMYI